MPKRKGGRKKRGGGKQNHLANPGNVHNPKNFGSDQGLFSGCAGCNVEGNIAIGSGCNFSSQAAAQEAATRGINRLLNGGRGQVGGIQTGGNAATTTFKDLQNAAGGGLGYSRAPVTSITNCGVTSSTSMGAGQRAQKGGGVSQTASCVAGCNNLGPAGYALNAKGTSDLNATLMGSGYPAVSPYNTNKCGGRTRKRRKHKKRRRTKRKRKKKRRTRRKRGGDVSTLQKMTQKWQQYIGFPPQLRGGERKKKRRGTRKKMKGGYAQFASNDPNTPGFSSPKPGPIPWATGSLSKSRQINCQNNYNHYTGRSSPSPVFDRAAPVTPFGGTA